MTTTITHPGEYVTTCSVTPLTIVALAYGRTLEAIGYARDLLEPMQQPQPDDLAALVDKAIRSWQEGKAKAARASLEQAAALAPKMGYL